MLTWIRDKLGPLGIGLVIGLIAVVFVFTGFFTPDAFYTGGAAGSVNGEMISYSDFQRSLNQRMEFFKNLKLSPEQLKAFRVQESVFNELVNRKLMVQEGQKLGMLPGEAEVRQAIREIPAFQKDGIFDFKQYKNVLASNRYTPTSFERLIRDDLIYQKWRDYFKQLVRVSDEEIRNEYFSENEKRSVKYVLLTNDMAKKGIKITSKELNAYLADKDQLAKVQKRFDAFKDTQYKGKKFDSVKKELAKEFILNEDTKKLEDFVNSKATQVLAKISKSKSSDKQIERILKPIDAKIQTTSTLSYQNRSFPGLGEVKELFDDAFANPSPIDGKAKKYIVPRGTLVALVTKVEKAELGNIDAKVRTEMMSRLLETKERELYDSYVRKLREVAEKDGAIKMNRELLGIDEEKTS